MNQTIEIVITILKSMSMDKRPSTLTPGTSYYPSTSTRNDTNLPLEYQTPDVTRNSRRFDVSDDDQMCTAARGWKRIARRADALGEIARQASNI
jgi:hypothetical protein